MCGLGSAWPTVPGTIAAGWARLGLPGFWAVPACGVAAALLWTGVGALGADCATAGVSPAAARAIAHPINLIFTPVCIALGRRRENRAPDLAVSIGAAFPSLKPEFR